MLNNSSNIPSEIYIFGYFIGIIELILHFLIIFISFLNFFILITTNILHPNLKILLLIQSLIILLFEIQRWIMVSLKFICLDIFRPGDQFLQDISIFTNMARNLIGHIILIERLLANKLVNKYENWRKPYFGLISIFILLNFSLLNVITNGKSWNATLINLISNSILLLFSFGEILIISIIGVQNIKKYIQFVPNIMNYSLSEKYQITENIRTSRQLAPVFFCHLLDNINYSILTYFIYFNIFIQSTYKQSLYYAITYIFTSLIEGIIQITVLTYHPTLRKTLLEHLKCLNVFKTKIYPNNTTTITSSITKTNITTSIKNIQGLELISQTNADLHFKMLIKSWN